MGIEEYRGRRWRVNTAGDLCMCVCMFSFLMLCMLQKTRLVCTSKVYSVFIKHLVLFEDDDVENYLHGTWHLTLSGKENKLLP